MQILEFCKFREKQTIHRDQRSMLGQSYFNTDLPSNNLVEKAFLHQSVTLRALICGISGGISLLGQKKASLRQMQGHAKLENFTKESHCSGLRCSCIAAVILRPSHYHCNTAQWVMGRANHWQSEFYSQPYTRGQSWMGARIYREPSSPAGCPWLLLFSHQDRTPSGFDEGRHRKKKGFKLLDMV